MNAGKWTIAKRRADENDPDAPNRESWPWLLTYPGGGRCFCFTHQSAVAIIKDSQRALRSGYEHFEWLKRRYVAGSLRTPELVRP